MRLVHLSDIHLGFRQYQRQTPLGVNQREADIAQTFTRVMDRVIELEPDVVLIGGDIFHVVRPTNQAILKAFGEFSRLVRALPRTRVVMVAGNHDLPKTSESGSILGLFARLDRIDVATTQPTRFHYPDLDLSVLAVPHMLEVPKLEADPAARHNVLLIHREIDGVIPGWVSDADRAARAIAIEDLASDEFDYVALGHYHVYQQVTPNAWYSGSTDYTSLNPWGDKFEEADHRIPGKGIIEHDLASGKHTFHPIPPSRDLVNIPAIDARGMSAAELDDAIRKAVDSLAGGIDDRIVRLVVRDVPRHIVRELDHRALREYRRRAFHFHLDPRKPESIRRDASGAPARRQSLLETVREKLQGRPLPSDIDREQFVALGIEYLQEAEQLETMPAAAAAEAAT